MPKVKDNLYAPNEKDLYEKVEAIFATSSLQYQCSSDTANLLRIRFYVMICKMRVLVIWSSIGIKLHEILTNLFVVIPGYSKQYYTGPAQ